MAYPGNNAGTYNAPVRFVGLGADGLPARRAPSPYQDGFAIPHVLTFEAMLNASWQQYWGHKYDEAYRLDDQTFRLVMWRQLHFQTLLSERLLALQDLEWEVEPDDAKDPHQVACADGLAKLVKGVPEFYRLIHALHLAVWPGRSGSQLVWQWDYQPLPVAQAQPALAGVPAAGPVSAVAPRRCLRLVKHRHVNGDKLRYKYDGTPMLEVYSPEAPSIPGLLFEPTDDGAYAAELRGGWRNRFVIHKHWCLDADFFDEEAQDAIHGVGLRSALAWSEWLRQEWLAHVAAGLERFADGGIRVWLYPMGNPAAEAEVRARAKDNSDRVNIVVPYDPATMKGTPMLDVIPMPVQGVEALMRLIEHLEYWQQRLVKGRASTSAHANMGGLGGGDIAETQEDDGRLILKGDARGVAETLTGHADNPGILWIMFSRTYPEYVGKFPCPRFRFVVPPVNGEQLMGAVQTFCGLGGVVITDQARRLIPGFSKPGPGDETLGGAAALAAEPGGPFDPGGDFGDEGGDDGPPEEFGATAPPEQYAADAPDPVGQAKQRATATRREATRHLSAVQNRHLKLASSYHATAAAWVPFAERLPRHAPHLADLTRRATVAPSLDHVTHGHLDQLIGLSIDAARQPEATAADRQHLALLQHHAGNAQEAIAKHREAVDAYHQAKRDAQGTTQNAALWMAAALMAAQPKAKPPDAGPRQYGYDPNEPRDGAAPSALPALADNYRKPLSHYAPLLHHETNAEGLLGMVDPTSRDNRYEGDVYLATHPHLALGQGANRGVQVRLHAHHLQGQVNTGKPGWDHLYAQGQAELVARKNKQEDFQRAVHSFTLTPHALGQRRDPFVGRLTRSVIPGLLRQGWTETRHPEGGGVSYQRPAESPQHYGYDPSEPRLPAGNPLGGEWTARGSGAPAPGAAQPATPAPAAGVPATPRHAALSATPVQKASVLGGGCNETQLVTLADGSKGVFKPADGERPGLRRTVPGDCWRREVAASELAELFGLGDLVPATVARDVGGRQGSLQAFVGDAKDAVDVPRAARYDGPEDLARAAAFDFVTLNTDRHASNWMIAGDKLTLIDNGLSFPDAHHFTEYGNSQLLGQAMERDLPIPEAVAAWAGKETEVRAALERNGLTGPQLELTVRRLKALGQAAADGLTFRELWAGEGIKTIDTLVPYLARVGADDRTAPPARPGPPPPPRPGDSRDFFGRAQ